MKARRRVFVHQEFFFVGWGCWLFGIDAADRDVDVCLGPFIWRFVCD